MFEFYKLKKSCLDNLTDTLLKDYPDYESDTLSSINCYGGECYYNIKIKKRQSYPWGFYFKLSLNGKFLSQDVNTDFNLLLINEIIAKASTLAKENFLEVKGKLLDFFNAINADKEFEELEGIVVRLKEYQESLQSCFPKWLNSKNVSVENLVFYYKRSKVVSLKEGIILEDGIGFFYNFLKKKDKDLTLELCIEKLKNYFDLFIRLKDFVDYKELNNIYHQKSDAFKTKYGEYWWDYKSLYEFKQTLLTLS